jgi:hypothetical protein
MKKLILLTFVCITQFVKAQAPQAIPYQAVARDNSGNLIINQSVSLRFTIHDVTTTGTIVYRETQSKTTNSLGLFTANIGQGTVVNGNFSTIDWETGSKFMQVELDVTGGTNYIDMGTQQMLSTPYALNAANGNWNKTGNDIFNSNSGNVGVGTNTPLVSAKVEISSTTKGFLPPRMNRTQRDAILSPVAGLIVWCTNCGSTGGMQVFNGTEWKNIFESGISSSGLSIGQIYGGGVIAYLLQPGDPGYDASIPHGIITPSVDQSSSSVWGCVGTLISGADGVTLGTGNQNTIDIMAGCSSNVAAARVCGNLVLNGFSDWYLPSRDELNKLYISQRLIGGFSSGIYWSSTEDSMNNAWYQDFSDIPGVQDIGAKNGFWHVRAIRTF